MKYNNWLCAFLLPLMLLPVGIEAQIENDPVMNHTEMTENNDKLVVLWTSGDREVALKMLFMYTYNAKKNEWWKDITLIVWGPSARLLSEDTELQEYVKRIMEAGVEVRACKGCADQYGVSEKLKGMGITVLYIGKEFTDYMKQGYQILTI